MNMDEKVIESSSKEEQSERADSSDVTETCAPEIKITDDAENEVELNETMVKEESNATKLERHSFKRRTIRKMLKRKSGVDSNRSSKEISQDEWDVDSIDKEPINTKRILEKQPSIHDDDDDEGTGDSNTSHDNQNNPVTQLQSSSKDDEEEGINDSITNMSLLGSFLYSVVSTMSKQVWILLRSTVSFVWNSFTSGGTKESLPADRDSTKEELKEHEDEEIKPACGTDDAARQRRLFNIANELMTTEEQYVKRLGVLVILKNETASLLSPDVAKAMFQNIEVIHQFHHDNLLPELQTRIEKWETISKIGDIMKKLTPFLKLYTEYVKNYETANNLLISWRQKNSAFEKHMKEAEVNAEYSRLRIQAHMLEPIQRVPRYELLLRDYLKKLPEDSADREDAQKALTLVAEAASHFEEMMKRDSRVSELMQLQHQFEGGPNIVHPDRALKHKTKLKVINPRTGKISEKVVHVFNDLLLLSSESWVPGASRFKVKYTFNLHQTKIGYGLNLEVNNVFYLTSKDLLVEIVTSDAEERKDWMEKIHKEMISSAEKNGLAHTDVPDRNYAYELQTCKRKQAMQLSPDNGKSWKKRTVAVYDNGLMTCFKSVSDKQPLSVVYLSDFNIALGSILQKKGQVCTLVGEGKIYHLYDDTKGVVERFYNEVSPFQLGGSNSEELILAEIARVSKKSPAPDAVSIDSGIDVQNARLSGLSTDSECSWIHTQAFSTESDVMEGDQSRVDDVIATQSIPGLTSEASVDSGVVEESVNQSCEDDIGEKVDKDNDSKTQDDSFVTLQGNDKTDGTEC